MNRPLSKLEKRLRMLWDGRTSPAHGPMMDFSKYRYTPRAYSDGGPGWGVYDKLGDRFLSDQEVVRLPVQSLMTATVHH
jgi:hypothetical protein